jgi:hypothetical protein
VAATGYVTVAKRALTRRQVRSRRSQQCRERPGRHDQSGDPRQKRATCPGQLLHLVGREPPGRDAR